MRKGRKDLVTILLFVGGTFLSDLFQWSVQMDGQRNSNRGRIRWNHHLDHILSYNYEQLLHKFEFLYLSQMIARLNIMIDFLLWLNQKPILNSPMKLDLLITLVFVIKEIQSF